MDNEPRMASYDEAEHAQRTIEQQAREIEHLRRRLADEQVATQLRQALALVSMTGTIASPVSHNHLLEMIVETAAQVIEASAASLFLTDHESQQLVFEVALGEKGQEVKKFTVPMGHGIAGLVAVSGQPMAISNAQQDPRQAADIAKSVGYMPESILCVPLFYNEEIIGVLELLDKKGAPSFDAADMHLLGVFARQAAVAIEQSLTHHNLAALVAEVLASLGNVPEQQKKSLQASIRTFVGNMEADLTYRQALELARLVQEIATQGNGELKACRAILESFAEYLRSRPAILSESDEAGGVWG